MWTGLCIARVLESVYRLSEHIFFFVKSYREGLLLASSPSPGGLDLGMYTHFCLYLYEYKNMELSAGS